MKAREHAANGMQMLYLNIGDPIQFDFQTPPHIIDAITASMKAGNNGYGPSEGTAEAVDAVTREAASKGIDNPHHVFLTTGASEAIELAMTALLDPGDELLVPSPGYPLYTALLSKLSAKAGDTGRKERMELVAQTKSAWLQQLSSMDHEDDDPGTTWNERARNAQPKHMSPRMAWRAIQASLPQEAIISSDIGNNCAIGNAYPTFEEGRKYLAPGLFGPCGYGLPAIMGAKIAKPDVPVVGFAGDGAFGISMNEMSSYGRSEFPAITMIIFRNYQWGAEKRNTTLWFDDNFVGTELDTDVTYAGIAQQCGVKGVQVDGMDALAEALDKAIEAQMKDKVTTFIEVVLNQELGEPFRRDAMKKPVSVAGIDPSDFRPQQPVS